MSLFVESFSLVTLAEIGDKTQLLSILLAARFKRFWPIVMGVLVATLLNHALVAWFGHNLAGWLEANWLLLISSLLFIAIGLWTLIPDHAPTEKTSTRGAFATSCMAFFIAEMGDKTQLATLTLGAKAFDGTEVAMVIVGTTAGMMAANIPAVLFGDKALQKIPLRAVRIFTCLMFVSFGLLGLWKWTAG